MTDGGAYATIPPTLKDRLSAVGYKTESRGGSREGWYLLLFAAQCLLCLSAIAWYELRHNTGDGLLETGIAVLRGMEAGVVVIAAWTYTVMEGGAMLYERYARKRFESGKAEGIVEGSEKTMSEWVAWNDRRLQAERQGRPFDEPPPSQRNGASGR